MSIGNGGCFVYGVAGWLVCGRLTFFFKKECFVYGNCRMTGNGIRLMFMGKYSNVSYVGFYGDRFRFRISAIEL